MKMQMRLVFVSLLSFLPLAFTQPQQSVPFSLAIKAMQASVKAGSTIELEVITTNISSQPITLSKSNPGMEYKFDVRDSGNKATSMTRELKRMKDPTQPHAIFRLFGKVLQPQESLREVIDVSDYYDLSAPGVYKIQLQRNIPEQLGSGVVKSNVISVRVTP